MRSQPSQRLLQQLRARGIRLTSQRAVLVNILDSAEVFMDVDTLCRMARRKGARVDRATVYRTLALLRTHDLLAPSVENQNPAAPAVVPPASNSLTLVCQQCGASQPFDRNVPDLIRQELQRITGFAARAVRLEAGGECHLCASRSRRHSRSKKNFQE